MTTISDNTAGKNTTQTLAPNLTITIPHPSECHSQKSRHKKNSSSSSSLKSSSSTSSGILRQPYKLPNTTTHTTPSSSSPYHGIIGQDSICSEDEKYYFMSEPSISEDSPSSSSNCNYTPQSSPNFGRRKTLVTVAGVGGGVEESKTCIDFFENDDDLSESMEDEDLLRHLKRPDDVELEATLPPPPSPMMSLSPPKEEERSAVFWGDASDSMDTSTRLMQVEKNTLSPQGTRCESRLESREFEINSDISYDDDSDGEKILQTTTTSAPASQKEGDDGKPTTNSADEAEGTRLKNLSTDPFLTAIQENDRSPNLIKLEEAEGLRRNDLCTESFLTAIQENYKSPNLVELGGHSSGEYVDEVVDLSGGKKLLLEPGFDQTDQLEDGSRMTVIPDRLEEREPVSKLEDSLLVARGGLDRRILWQQQQQAKWSMTPPPSDTIGPAGNLLSRAQSVQDDANENETTNTKPIIVSSNERIRTSTTTRRGHHKHKQPQANKEDRETDCHPTHQSKSNIYNINNDKSNNDSDSTRNTDTTTPHTNSNKKPSITNSEQRKKPKSHADEDSDHLALLADDEQIRTRSRRSRLYSNESRQTKKRHPGHRRTRSGDDAAATLLTGGTEWIGMELDELPLPSFGDEDEDEDGLVMLEKGGVGGEKDDAGSGVGVCASKSGSRRRQNIRFGLDVGSDRSSAGRRSGASDNNINNGESGGNSRESRRKSKQQQQSSSFVKKQKELGGAPWEKSRGLPTNVLDLGTVGDLDDAGNQQQKERRQQQHQPEWFDPSISSVGAKYNSNEDSNHNTNNNNYKFSKSGSGIVNSIESKSLPSSSWVTHQQQQQQHQQQHHHHHHQQQQHHQQKQHNSNNSNINNSKNNNNNNVMHSALYTADDRQESIGDASISTIESIGSHSVFSWISNKVSVTASSASKHDYYHSSGIGNGSFNRKDNTDASLNFSDDDDHHGGSSVKDQDGIFAMPGSTDTCGDMDMYLKREDMNSRRRRISPEGDGAMESQFLRLQQRSGSSKGKEEQHLDPTLGVHQHVRKYTPEFFPNLGSRRSTEAVKRKEYPIYTCPRCKEERRMFFTVNSAPNKILEGPAAYLGIYIGIYMLVSLTILGLEEGWPRLDCIYFSVMTLTTSGLGDYVPSSDSAKIMCSILIYFGIAFIGLLLGTLQANSLDDVCQKADKESMMNNCQNCSRLQNRKKPIDLEAGKYKSMLASNKGTSSGNIPEHEKISLLSDTTSDPQRSNATLQTINETNYGSTSTTVGSTPSPESLPLNFMGLSNMVDSSELSTSVALMNRQSHTRHSSFDDNELHRNFVDRRNVNMVESDDAYVSSGDSVMSNAPCDGVGDVFQPVSRVKAAKYVFLTMKQAVANTVLIIVIGIVGFYYIEPLTLVDAFYFTMVLLTAVGYGDITPTKPEGKLFASVYCLVAGFVVLKNVSMISTIPLELRKRRLERAVLTQFGNELDEVALRELATGPLVRRLQISEDHPDVLDKCTREMFALAMLVRLGRITEQDVKMTYAAFQQLDKDNDGVLTSKEIIMSMAVEQRKKSGGGRGLSSTSRERDDGGEGSWDGERLQSVNHLSNLSHPLTSTQNSSSERHASYNSTQTTTMPDFDAPRINNYRPRVTSGRLVESQFSGITHDDIMEGSSGTDHRNVI